MFKASKKTRPKHIVAIIHDSEHRVQGRHSAQPPQHALTCLVSTVLSKGSPHGKAVKSGQRVLWV